MRLTFVFVNNYITEIAAIHENHYRPPEKRTVQIELTDEQNDKLKPRIIGSRGLENVYEKIYEVFIEEGK